MNQPLASIHPNAKIAENVIIGPFCTIEEDVVIEEGSQIGPNAVIMNGARIGKNCRVFPGAVVSAIPQDLKFGGEVTTTEIGDNTTIRECATINRGTSAYGKTVIGESCLIMAYVHVAHDCIVGEHCILGNAVQLAGHVEVGDWAIISGTSAVHQFNRIGKHVMVPGGSLIRKDIPPFCKTTREPLRYGGINVVGLQRRGFNEEQIKTIHEVYRTIYLRDMNISQGVDFVAANLAKTPETEEILTFFRKSERGTIGGPAKIQTREN